MWIIMILTAIVIILMVMVNLITMILVVIVVMLRRAPGNLTNMLILIMLVNGNQLCSKRHLAICLYHDSHDVVGDGDYVQ